MIPREAVRRLNPSDVTTGEMIANVTPGDVLRVEFMEPLGLSIRTLARELDVPPNRITAIIRGARAITAETAIRLGRQFGMSAEFWMNLQTAHDLEEAHRSVDLAS